MDEIEDIVNDVKDQGGGISTVFYNKGNHSFPANSDRIKEANLTQGAALVFGPIDGQGQTVYCNDKWIATIG